MNFFAGLRMLLANGALEVTTEVQNRIAIKSIVFADGDVISLADPELITPALTLAHAASVNTTLGNATRDASHLAWGVKYAAGTLGIAVFVANFSAESFLLNNLALALTCVAGSALGQVGLGLLGRRLFRRLV